MPERVRVRFGEEMALIFRDLCREHVDARGRLFWLALWIYRETLVAIIRENAMHVPQLGKTTLRVALGALAVWMVAAGGIAVC